MAEQSGRSGRQRAADPPSPSEGESCCRSAILLFAVLCQYQRPGERHPCKPRTRIRSTCLSCLCLP